MTLIHCRLRLSERSLRDELDAARISAQIRENELLAEIQVLQSNQRVVFEEVGHLKTWRINLIFDVQANDVCDLLESDSGEMSMELATPLLPSSVMLDISSPALYFDPSSIPLPPSPDNHPLLSSPTLSQVILTDRNAHHEHPDLAGIELDHSARTLQPP